MWINYVSIYMFYKLERVVGIDIMHSICTGAP